MKVCILKLPKFLRLYSEKRVLGCLCTWLLLALGSDTPFLRFTNINAHNKHTEHAAVDLQNDFAKFAKFKTTWWF